MVVTRRTPVVPPPPPPLARNPPSRGTQLPLRTSRTNDTASVNAISSVPAASPASAPGDRDRNAFDNSPKKTKKSRRRAKTKYQKSNFQAFLDFLTKLLLLAFTIYTFSVCPQDAHQQSLICRGLTEYKRIILDPYIIPPIQAMLAHPSIAPHIESAKPYVHHAVDVTAPILLRTQQVWNLHVAPQWEQRVVPGWKKYIVPQWDKHVVPQWDKHITPHIQHALSKVEPHRLRVVQEYEQRVAPRARVAFYNLQRWQRRAEPYVLLVASKTKDGYYAAKPYAVPLARKAGHLLQRFALLLQEQRQKFVDPHVAKIWEKVKELSRAQAIREAMPDRQLSSSEAICSASDTLGYETTSSTGSRAPEYVAILTSEETDVTDILPPISPLETTQDESPFTATEPTFIPESRTSVLLADGPTRAETFLSTESILVETSHESELPTFSASATVTPPILASAISSSTPPDRDKPAKSPTLVGSSKISVPAASATVPPVQSTADDKIDLDAFYAELGLDEPLGNPEDSKEYNSASPSQPTEAEDERAERLRLKAEETARKRADIEARQVNWESALEAQMKRSTSQLQTRLSHLRAAAASELASSTDIRNSIEQLVSEAERYIKGAEIYLKNLKGENRRSDEKQALWDRVADRVNDKFNERLSATEGVVDAWYKIVLAKELQEVATVTAEVREVAEKGQLDLGLDYAWLEDVTHDDWQRYHALIGASERYAHEAASIQNGTHPWVAVTNPIASTFADLESEVQDVVIGFETRLRRIKRDGERAFNHHGNCIGQKEEEKGTIVEQDPEVSTPPVPQEQGPVTIRRCQEEVLEALGNVEPVGESEGAVGGSSVDTMEAVSRLVREMDGGAKVDHAEL